MKALALILLLLWPGLAQANCRQALILALDVSGSVDVTEDALQRNGLADALLAPEVAQALLSTPGWPVHIAVFEWAGPTDQTLVTDWTPVTTTTLPQIAATLRAPRPRPDTRNTAIGAAIAYAEALFARGPDCGTRTLDLSADGKNNAGPAPYRPDFTINALAIGADPLQAGDEREVHVAELSSYFRAQIIHGPGAFVEVALGYSDYAAAMRRKLLREIATLVMGSVR